MSFMGVLTEEQIKEDAQQQLKAWEPEHDYLVCLDTDGHVLDNMWAKQLIVFHPHFMDMNHLRDIEMFFRLHAEHHNLWGTTRGCDRYLAVQHTLSSLLEDPQAKEQLDEDHVRDLLDSVSGYVDWVNASGGEKAFGIPSLFEYHQENGLDYNITRLLSWSEAVDRSFEFVTLEMPPFPHVEETLRYLSERADILIVSSTPYSDLSSWWQNTDLAKYTKAIAGKEMGKKTQHIGIVKERGGYDDDKVIMGGDGGGDLKAARANNVSFFPTPAGKEKEAWENARDTFEAFFEGRYRGEMEEEKVNEFQNILLEKGPWEEPGYDAEEEYRKLQQKRIDTYKQLHPQGKLFTLE